MNDSEWNRQFDLQALQNRFEHFKAREQQKIAKDPDRLGPALVSEKSLIYAQVCWNVFHEFWEVTDGAQDLRQKEKELRITERSGDILEIDKLKLEVDELERKRDLSELQSKSLASKKVLLRDMEYVASRQPANSLIDEQLDTIEESFEVNRRKKMYKSLTALYHNVDNWEQVKEILEESFNLVLPVVLGGLISPEAAMAATFLPLIDKLLAESSRASEAELRALENQARFLKEAIRFCLIGELLIIASNRNSEKSALTDDNQPDWNLAMNNLSARLHQFMLQHVQLS